MDRNDQLYDAVRIDHFRGFSEFWEVPADEETAINGKWAKGPGKNFFNKVVARNTNLDIIAEDLGDIDQAVYDLRDKYEFPGMRVLQFAFGNDMPFSIHIPHNYTKNSVVYTGTHDNNTLQGWYNVLTKTEKNRVSQYLGKKLKKKHIHKDLIRLAYKSVAETAIIPMQDVLGLGKDAVMNQPGKTNGNWKWKLTKKWYSKKLVTFLRNLVDTYGRY
jgi:4-alpha-glucanotransferase